LTMTPVHPITGGRGILGREGSSALPWVEVLPWRRRSKIWRSGRTCHETRGANAPGRWLGTTYMGFYVDQASLLHLSCQNSRGQDRRSWPRRTPRAPSKAVVPNSFPRATGASFMVAAVTGNRRASCRGSRVRSRRNRPGGLSNYVRIMYYANEAAAVPVGGGVETHPRRGNFTPDRRFCFSGRRERFASGWDPRALCPGVGREVRGRRRINRVFIVQRKVEQPGAVGRRSVTVNAGLRRDRLFGAERIKPAHRRRIQTAASFLLQVRKNP